LNRTGFVLDLRLPVVALVFLAVAGCGRRTAGGDRILRIAYEREIDLLNPFTSQNLADIAFSMIEGLVTTDQSNRYVPVLATTIPTVENGLVRTGPAGGVEITWPLRTGVLWHDGQPFTSRDVCFTWKFVVDPASETYNREQYLGIKGCRTPNDSTVVFEWDRAYGYYQGLFEAVLPEHVLGRMTAAEIVTYEPYNRGPATIGTGPFRFAEWKAGEYIRVVRNEHYWRGDQEPRIDQIVWAFIPDANTRLNAIKAGQYDFARILPTQVRELADRTDYRTHLINSNSFLHLELSIATERGKRLFADPRVREAIFRGIDRNGIASGLMEGAVTVAESPLNPSSPFFDSTVRFPPYDPDGARRLLDLAGWTLGGDGIRTRDGERLAFTMINRAGATDRIAVAQAIQAQLKAVGIGVEFETLESAAWTLRWRRKQWESIVSAWFLPADPSLTNLYGCHGANNMTGFCDPELDRILERSDHTLDVAARKVDLARVQALLARTMRTLPIYYNVVPEVVSTRVGNYQGSGTNFGSFWNLHQWTVAK
jgi:peptide/nickel transport system substrate-binding protein